MTNTAHIWSHRPRTCSAWRALALTGLLFTASGSPQDCAAATWPEAVLQNDVLKLRYYLPDGQNGYYRGTRFDWSGLISRVEYAGHSFFSEFKREHDPLNHDDICGTAEEFGISAPPGYAQAGAGELFLKIGIGLLEKPDGSPYSFAKRYKIARQGTWEMLKTGDSVNFRQRFTGSGGWAYDYLKSIEIDPQAPVLTIRRVLQNSGQRPIETDHYGHNFLQIDGMPAGPEYVVEFPFEPKLGQGSRTQGGIEARGRSLVFLKPIPDGQAVWLRIEGFGSTADNRITLRNTRTGAAMEIATDQPPVRMAFYSSGGVLSPEPFVDVKIPPGGMKEWKTVYTFSVKK